MASMIKVRVQDSMMDVYLATPARQAGGPAIVLMFHRGGIRARNVGAQAPIQL